MSASIIAWKYEWVSLLCVAKNYKKKNRLSNNEKKGTAVQEDF